MSNTRDNILSALRRSVHEQYEMPDLDGLKPITFADPVAEFKQKTTTTAGASLKEVADITDLNAIVRTIAENLHPSGEIGEGIVIASNLPGIDARLYPDTVGEALQLCRADIGVVQGTIGVAENACIWIPQTMKERAVCFASEHLVIVLHADNIVNNMHEAYARIEASAEYFRDYPFGTFISGPSKTADIEGALVYGAQAARAVTVVLVNSK